jgi:hypothetical protein
MKRKLRAYAAVFAVLLLGSLGVAQLESILKAGGVAAVVSIFGKDIDEAIDGLTGHKDTAEATTKVVPIISIGDSGYIGAAQVMGSKAQVDKVQAVGQLEGTFAGRTVRLKGLIPISTTTPGKTIDRVPGVGVSAIVDIKL